MFVLWNPEATLASDQIRAVYVGGTIAALKSATTVSGRLDASQKTALTFHAEDEAHLGLRLEITYARVERIEYKHIASGGRDRASWFAPGGVIDNALNPPGREHHYMIAWFNDADEHEQAVVLEFDKKAIRDTLAIVAQLWGKRISGAPQAGAKVRK